MEFIIKIENQNVNGVDYTAEQFLQGLEQVVSDYNQRTGENLTNAQWLQWAHYQNLAAWFEQGKGSEPIEPIRTIDALNH